MVRASHSSSWETVIALPVYKMLKIRREHTVLILEEYGEQYILPTASMTPDDVNWLEEQGEITRISEITLTTEKTSSSVPPFRIWFSKDTSKEESMVSPESTTSATICMSINWLLFESTTVFSSQKVLQKFSIWKDSGSRSSTFWKSHFSAIGWTRIKHKSHSLHAITWNRVFSASGLCWMVHPYEMPLMKA